VTVLSKSGARGVVDHRRDLLGVVGEGLLERRMKCSGLISANGGVSSRRLPRLQQRLAVSGAVETSRTSVMKKTCLEAKLDEAHI